MMDKLHKEYIPKFNKPVLCIEGEHDVIVCNKAIRAFYNSCNSANKELISYSGANHEPHKDNDYWPQLVNDIVEWQKNI